jgi:response regulator RpfG family c-di-GMP phosphodiesterase
MDAAHQEVVITATARDSISDAAICMRDNRIGSLVVVDDDGRMVGIISERDIVARVTAETTDPFLTKVGDIMITSVVSCTLSTRLDEIRELMSKFRIRHVVVIDDDRPVGVISSREILDRKLDVDRSARNMTIFALARLAETRDTDTGVHLERVREYTRILAIQLQRCGRYTDLINDRFVELIYSTSPLHDIGKVSIPDSVLLKPGRLNDAEYEIMKTHSEAGADTLALALMEFPDVDFLCMARDIAGYHHERVDGTGYPNGLAGEDIPLAARIFSVVDVYDALVSKRVYKEAFSPIIAKDIIIKGAGTQFDEAVVAAFVECEPTFVEIYNRYSLATAAVA